MERFQDRTDAGQQLAKLLLDYKDKKDVLILGLPRGGLPVADEVAKALNAPLDVCLVRKLGVPGQRELAMGAISLGDVEYLNGDIIRSLNISQADLERIRSQERQELERRNQLYRKNRPAPEIKDKIVILIDDGIATGATLHAAIRAVQHQHPKSLIIGVPGASPSACDTLDQEVDEVCCGNNTSAYFGVSQWYWNFGQVSSDEGGRLLDNASRR